MSSEKKQHTLSDPRAVSDGVLLLSQSSSDHRVWTGGFRRTLGADIIPAVYSNDEESASVVTDETKGMPPNGADSAGEPGGNSGSSSSSTTSSAHHSAPSPPPSLFSDPLSRYSKPINYWDYIHPDVLCSLQKGREGKGLNYHDEHMFILIHQTFELWFKQALFELDYVRDVLLGRLVDSKLEYSPVGRALQRLQRADRCLRLASQGYDIMETMDPEDFLEFRDFLVPASGFQSIQFRELEILMGLKDDERLKMAGKDYREAFIADDGVNKTDVFDRRLSEPSLKSAVNVFLTSLQWPELNEFLPAYLQCMNKHSKVKVKDIEDELKMLERMAEKCKDEKVDVQYIQNLQSKVRASLAAAHVGYDDIKSWFEEISPDGKEEIGKARGAALLVLTYNNHPHYAPIAQLLNGLLLFEQGIVMLRQRHARMVEFFIGRRPGTGGTSGVEYIDKTATVYRVFTDLARIRSLQIQRGKITFDPKKYHPIDQLTAHPARAAGRYQQFEQKEETAKKTAAATAPSAATTTEATASQHGSAVTGLPPSHPRVPANLMSGGCPFMAGDY